jgi:hypothetical protein
MPKIPTVQAVKQRVGMDEAFGCSCVSASVCCDELPQVLDELESSLSKLESAESRLDSYRKALETISKMHYTPVPASVAKHALMELPVEKQDD